MHIASDDVIDDRTAKARIRDAAIECVAEHGVAGTTARKVATAAGVSPGLVIHHFGSMEGLRSACDEYIAATIRQEKRAAMSAGTGLNLLDALSATRAGSLMGYLSQVLVDDSPVVTELVDSLVTDAEAYLEEGVEAGMLRPATNPRGRAAVLTLWSLGAIVLHHHVKRILGADLTDPEAGQVALSYTAPVYEILGEGIMTAPLIDQVRAVGFAAERSKSAQKPSIKGRP